MGSSIFLLFLVPGLSCGSIVRESSGLGRNGSLGLKPSRLKRETTTSCGTGQWKCVGGSCVSFDGKCDGVVDCPDGSDETFALCGNNTQIQVSKCILPPYPLHGTYTVGGEGGEGGRRAAPGDAYPSALLNFTCRRGYDLNSNSSTSYCQEGTWYGGFPKCVRACRLYRHESVEYRCLISGSRGEEGTRNCTPYEPIGTVVRVECMKPYYYSPRPLPLMRCIEGSWDTYPTCTPECGRITPKATELTADGISDRESEIPWHVAVYRREKNQNLYQQLCGGSLVSTTHVISAAHCFWSDIDKILPASNFAVAVGKLYSSWDHPEDFHAQKSEVREIKIPPKFLGSATNFQDDIAVLTLKTAILYRPNVGPVCLNFDYQFDNRQLQAGKFGRIAGWRLSGTNRTRGKVDGALIQFMSIEDCLKNSPSGFREYITSDKFCTGNAYGTTLCKGDSGAGLAFPEVERGVERHYLRGVLSVAPRTSDLCAEFTIAAFTQLLKHEHFVKDARACRLYRHESVEYRCLISGSHGEEVTRNCTPYEPDGTIVRVKCKKPNYYSPQPLPLMRCIEGSWDTYPTCTPECGRITPKATELIADGISGGEGEIPWHVAVYRRMTTQNLYQQLCGGSLVSTTHVITAAHCFWSDIDKILPASNFAVAVGKLYSSWDHPEDFNAQKSEVREIKIPPKFLGSATNFQDDIAVLTLKTAILYRPNVGPVCLNFDYQFDNRQLQAGKFGRIAGWRLSGTNRTRGKVDGALIQFMSIEDCLKNSPSGFREYITSDKFCTGNAYGTTLCKGDSGAGLAFPEVERGVERHYLRGVLSVAPRTPELCAEFTIAAFTQLLKHEHFVKDAISTQTGLAESSGCREDEWRCNDGSCILSEEKCDNVQNCKDGSDESSAVCEEVNLKFGKCVLPPYPARGTYTMKGKTDARPGQRVFTALLSYTCDDGYGITNETNQIFCFEGSWYGSSPLCVRMCRLVQHPSVEYRCRVPELDGYRPCNAQEPLGTVVHTNCRAPLYYYVGVLATMRCQEYGWDNNPVCLPECGRLTPGGMQLVVGGQGAKRGEVPWHAGIYRTIDYSYSQVCGGSIISTTLVISAAHCFWNDVQKRLPASLFAVAVGKLYRDWDHPNDTDAQKLEISNIVIPSRFRGSATNFQDDIALVILATAIRYEVFVRPVCLDFDHDLERRQLAVGKIGKVAGWGLTAANGDFAPHLQVTNLPYVDIDQCLDQVPLAFRELVTSDKFCAGYTNGTAMCQGDSGGGLAFPAESDGGGKRYFLRGIVSTAPRNNDKCTQFTITTFTQVTRHVHFIKDYL